MQKTRVSSVQSSKHGSCRAQPLLHEAAVLSVGPCWKFRLATAVPRRCTLPEVWHEHYDSCELGAALGDAVLARVAGGGSSPGNRSLGCQQDGCAHLPQLQRAKTVSCRLPGSAQVFLFAASPAAIAAPRLAPPVGGCTLISCASDRSSVLSVCLDASDTIHAIGYVGLPDEAPPRAGQLANLVGLPLSYIAAGLGLPDRLAAQLAAHGDGAAGLPMEDLQASAPGDGPGVFVLQRDALDALRQPWAQMLWHDSFPDLRRALLQAVGGGQMAAEEAVQVTAVSVVKRCAEELPGYQVPGSIV